MPLLDRIGLDLAWLGEKSAKPSEVEWSGVLGLLNNFFISTFRRGSVWRVIGILGFVPAMLDAVMAVRQIVVYSCRVLVFHGPVHRCTAIIALYALGELSSNLRMWADYAWQLS